MSLFNRRRSLGRRLKSLEQFLGVQYVEEEWGKDAEHIAGEETYGELRFIKTDIKQLKDKVFPKKKSGQR